MIQLYAIIEEEKRNLFIRKEKKLRREKKRIKDTNVNLNSLSLQIYCPSPNK